MDGQVTMSDFYETSARVRYAETDRMGVVYYANFLVWFEIGRVETFRQMGFSYKEMEETDDSWAVVAEAHCRYLKPALYDDVIRIRTRVIESRSRTLRFGYEILRESTGDLLATGETLHVICDGRGRSKALPEKYRQFFPLIAPPPADVPK
jgi:acyl-CoA thioester hydrolase